MRAWRRAGLALVVLGACNGRFAFDEHDDASAEAGAPGPDSHAPEEPALCSLQSVACPCSGTFCSCARQQWCRFTGSVCTPGSQCAFLCHNGSRCDGQCQGDCKLECEHESTCLMVMGENAVAEAESSMLTLTVGDNSRVHCENNATCHVTCTGPCTLECQSGARCDLQCPGDSRPRSADFGSRCPR